MISLADRQHMTARGGAQRTNFVLYKRVTCASVRRADATRRESTMEIVICEFSERETPRVRGGRREGERGVRERVRGGGRKEGGREKSERESERRREGGRERSERESERRREEGGREREE